MIARKTAVLQNRHSQGLSILNKSEYKLLRDRRRTAATSGHRLTRVLLGGLLEKAMCESEQDHIEKDDANKEENQTLMTLEVIKTALEIVRVVAQLIGM